MPDDTAKQAIAPWVQYFGRRESEVVEELKAYQALLERWQRAQNLVSRETLGVFWDRHIADSLQLLPLFKEDDRTILDLGSGGGLPAVPLAIAIRGTGRRFLLIDANQRKVAFLRTVSRALDLDVEVHAARIEKVDSRETSPADVVTARALAPLGDLLGLLHPLLSPKGRALLHKGREHVDELAESRAGWHHDVVVHQSVTSGGGVVLEISNIRAVRSI